MIKANSTSLSFSSSRKISVEANNIEIGQKIRHDRSKISQNRNYLFHTHNLNLTGGSNSILNTAQGLSVKGHRASIILEKNIIEYSIPEKISLYIITAQGVKPINIYKNVSLNKKGKKNVPPKQKIRNKMFQKSIIKYIWIWGRYIKNLLFFPIKNYHVKKFLKQNHFDVVISNNMYFYLEHLFYYKNSKNLFLAIRNSPTSVFKNRITPHIFPLKKYLSNITCVCISKGVEIEMFKYIDKDKTSLLTIYSPFNFEKIRALTKETIEKELLKINYMVSICSLSKGKRVDLILKAFSRIKNKDLYLIIIGKGSELEYLFELSCKLDLCSKVKFLGAVENPYKYIYHSKGLILASESEGLPRVLIESLICGIPVISTDCPHGPKEILVENLKNFLIPIIARNEIDIIDDLSIKIDELLINPPEIYEKNLDKFSMQNVIKQWEKLC